MHNNLIADGFRTFVRRTEGIAVLFKEAAIALLENVEISPSQIDHVIFSTQSFATTVHGITAAPSKSRDLSAQLIGVLSELGVTDAAHMGLWMADCGNLCQALLVADALIRSGSAENILILSGEVLEDGRSRIGPDGNLYSDVVVATLITRMPGSAEIISGIGVHNNEQGMIDGTTSFNGVSKNLSRLRSAMQQAGILSEASSFDHIVIGNLNRAWILFVAKFLRLSVERINSPSFATIGHARAADLLINLALCSQSAGGAWPRKAALVSTSERTAHVIELKLAGPMPYFFPA